MRNLEQTFVSVVTKLVAPDTFCDTLLSVDGSNLDQGGRVKMQSSAAIKRTQTKMTKLTSKFGQRIAELRKERGLSQRDLSMMVRKSSGEPIGLSSIGHIETGREKLARETCLNVITALGVSKSEEKELIELLDKWLESVEKPAYPTFGRRFAAILSDYSLEAPGIAKATNTTPSFIWYLKEGAKLPGVEVFKLLVKHLREQKISKEDLAALERAYIYDAVFYNTNLQYLTVNKRREAAEAASQVI